MSERLLTAADPEIDSSHGYSATRAVGLHPEFPQAITNSIRLNAAHATPLPPNKPLT